MYERMNFKVNHIFSFKDAIRTAVSIDCWFELDREDSIDVAHISIRIQFDKEFEQELRIKEYVEANAYESGSFYTIGDPISTLGHIKAYFMIETQLNKFFYDLFKQFVNLGIHSVGTNELIASSLILREQFDLLNQ